MTKSELKQARKELIDMMHILRKKQEERKNKILKNTGEKYNHEIDKFIIKVALNNTDYNLNKPTQESMDKLINDLVKTKK